MTFEQIEKAIKPQFVWMRGLKPLQTDEVMEGSKDVARSIFVGVSDMYGLKYNDISSQLDMSYTSYTRHLSLFREQYAINRPTIVNRFGVKTQLVLNYINVMYKKPRFLNIEAYGNI